MVSPFRYRFQIPTAEAALQLYHESGITSEQWTLERMKSTLENSSLILCCYSDNKLIGIVRGITDKYWIAHISHLAVHPEYQKLGIGRKLVLKVREYLGDGVALMVHSVPEAKEFYEKLGFEPYLDVYRIPRKS